MHRDLSHILRCLSRHSEDKKPCYNIVLLSLFASPPSLSVWQESLDREVELDPMEGEQTWPTEEELAGAVSRLQTPPTGQPLRPSEARRVPRGTSDYQAAWIVADSEDEVTTFTAGVCVTVGKRERYFTSFNCFAMLPKLCSNFLECQNFMPIEGRLLGGGVLTYIMCGSQSMNSHACVPEFQPSRVSLPSR